jgi:ribose transport system substrate-binding protein
MGVLALLAGLLVVIGCGGGEESGEAGGGQEGPVVGFTTITLTDPFFVRLNNGMKEAAQRRGVDLIINNPNGDPTAQANAIENFTQQQVDVIIVDPIDPNGVLPSMRAAKEAGIPVMAVDEVLEDVDFIDASVGHDNREVGKRLGEELVEEQRRTGEDYRVGIVQTFDAPIENTRVAGFQEAVSGNPNIEVVGRTDAKFNVERAATGAENLITSDPKLNWFYTTGGNYGIGVWSAIQSQGKQGDVRFLGWDMTEQLVAPMKNGTYLMAAQQDAKGIGETAIDVAVRLSEGEEVPRFNFAEVDYVTKENVDQVASRLGE